MPPPYVRLHTDEQVYARLSDALVRQDLILFAGAGLSAQATTPHGDTPPLWRECLEQMTLWCLREGLLSDDLASQIQESLDRGLLLEAAQELEDVAQPATALQRCLTDVLHYSTAETSRAHKAATRIRFRGFITTNYDDLIENAYVVTQRRALPRFYEDTAATMLDSWRRRQQFILKMHGDLVKPASIILGSRSYDRIMYSNEAFSRAIETIIGASSLLFVGFGGTDPNLERLLARTAIFDGRSKRHWLLTSASSMPSLRAKRLWEDKGLNIVTYPGPHSQVITFLNRLQAAVNTRRNEYPRFD